MPILGGGGGSVTLEQVIDLFDNSGGFIGDEAYLSFGGNVVAPTMEYIASPIGNTGAFFVVMPGLIGGDPYWDLLGIGAEGEVLAVAGGQLAWSSGVGYKKLAQSGTNDGTLTLYDDTATTGVTTLTVRAGAGQATTDLQKWTNVSATTLAKVGYDGKLEFRGGLVRDPTATTGTTRLDIRQGDADYNTGNYALRFLDKDGAVFGGITWNIAKIVVATDDVRDVQASAFILDTSGLNLRDTKGIQWASGAPYEAKTLGLIPNGTGILKLTNGGSGYGVLETGVLSGSYTVYFAAGADVGFVEIPVTSNSLVGGTIEYIVEVDDGTDYQLETGILQFGAVNKAGTVMTETPTVIDAPLQVRSAGTLTVTWAATAGSAKVTLKVNAVSSLSETTLRIKFRPHLQSGPLVPTAL